MPSSAGFAFQTSFFELPVDLDAPRVFPLRSLPKTNDVWPQTRIRQKAVIRLFIYWLFHPGIQNTISLFPLPVLFSQSLNWRCHSLCYFVRTAPVNEEIVYSIRDDFLCRLSLAHHP